MNKKFAWLFWGSVFTIFSSVVVAKETIRIASGEWPPYLSQKLKHYGVASRIVTEAFALEGVEVKYDFFPWGRAYALVKHGERDGSVIWTIKEERKDEVYFSDPVFHSQGVFLHLNNVQFQWNPHNVNFNDLKGKVIGTLIGSKHGPEFDKAEAMGLIRVQRVVSDRQNIQKLLKGRIDVAMSDLLVGYHILNTQFGEKEAALITHTPWKSEKDSYHLVLSKKVAKNKHFLTLFNHGLKKLRDSGKFEQYIEQVIRRN